MANETFNFIVTEAAQKAATTSTLRKSQLVKEVVIDDAAIGPIEAVYTSPRVLSQTPKAGTQVVRGTVVNVVYGNGRKVKADIVVGGSQRFKGQELGTIYDQYVKDDLTINSLIEKYTDAGALSDSERSQFTRSMAAKGVEVGDDVDGVMSVLGAAQTFNADAD